MSADTVQPFIIDAHIHLGHMADFYMPDNSLERMIRIMDKCGIEAVIASHIVGIMTNHFEYAYAETLKAVTAFPGRIYGFGVFNPHFPKESLELVKAHLGAKGFVGVKVHPAGHRYPLDGENYKPLWEYTSRNGVPVLTHTWDATPQNTYPFELVPAQENAQPKLVGTISDRYPTLSIIMAHSGGHYQGHLQAIEAARTHKNVYVDIAGETIGFGLIEWFVKEIGAEKILFGSDINWLDPRAHIGRVLGARITAEDRERIFFRNARSLFRLL
jgi:predicted TIM-barrel fold metal-dependent hydrolase